MYILHVKCYWITLNMVCGVSQELSHKILVHNSCSLKLMDSSQSVMEFGISFTETVTHRIFVIYLNRTLNIPYDINFKSWKDCILRYEV
jgi:hypothetical protein